MYVNEFFKPGRVGQNSFDRISRSETQTIAIKSDGAKQNIINTPDGVIFFCFLGFGAIWLIIFLIFPRLRKLAKDRTGTIKLSDPVPCRNCRYFADSPYLKCAVHPHTALTQGAIDCPDYCIKSGQK